MENGTIKILLNDYEKAPEGSLLIKKGEHFVPISFDELIKEEKSKIKELEKIPEKLKGVERNINHFQTYAKNHFLLVFNSFKIKILGGEIDVRERELLELDDAVLNDKISVKDAIEKHPYLKELFTKLYINKEDTLKEIQE